MVRSRICTLLAFFVCMATLFLPRSTVHAESPTPAQFHCATGANTMTVEPDQWTTTMTVVFRCKALVDGADTVVIVPPVSSSTLTETTDLKAVSDVSVSPHAEGLPRPGWDVKFPRPVARGEAVQFEVSIKLVTDRNAYPDQRIREGTTPLGAYWLPYDFWSYDGEWYRPELTMHPVVPPGWVAFIAKGWAEPAAFAGPYTHHYQATQGHLLEVYTFGDDATGRQKVDDIQQWAGNVISVLGSILGHEVGTRRWTILEVPKYHGGGEVSGDVISFTHELVDGLSGPDLTVKTLAYHEMGHLWPVGVELEGWPGAKESYTDYLSVLVQEQADSRQAALERLLKKEENYLDLFPGDEPLISDVVGFDITPADHALRYDKFTWFWHGLRFLMGDDQFFAFLRELHDRYNPMAEPARWTLDEFAEQANKHADINLGPYIKQWFSQPGAFGYSVSKAKSVAFPSFNPRGSRWRYRTTLVLTSTGALRSPRVQLMLSGEGRSMVTEVVTSPRATGVEVETDFPVRWVVVDPNDWLLGVQRTPVAVKVVGPGARFGTFALVGAALLILVFLFRRYSRRPVVRSLGPLP